MYFSNDPIVFEASRATVPGSARGDTGYEEHSVSEVEVERTFEAVGESQDVVVTNWQAEYDRAIDLSEVGLPGGERIQAAVFTRADGQSTGWRTFCRRGARDGYPDWPMSVSYFT